LSNGEREIGAFKPIEYWTLEAVLHPEKQADQKFKAKFIGIGGEPARVANGAEQGRQRAIHRNSLPDKKSMDEVLAALEKANWSVTSVQARTAAPAAGSVHYQQLQRDAANKLGYKRAPYHGPGAAAL